MLRGKGMPLDDKWSPVIVTRRDGATIISSAARELWSIGSVLMLMVASFSACRPEHEAQQIRKPGGLYGLQAFASHLELPIYPTESIQAGRSGLAVAEVSIDGRGTVRGLTVLEAPDSNIARSVEKAIRDSSFVANDAESGTTLYIGKLYFYFRLQGNSGVVLTPKDF